MRSGELLGRIELLHTLLDAARRLTATERACLWHGGFAHALGDRALELSDAAQRAAATGEMSERAGDTLVTAVPIPGGAGGLAVGMTTADRAAEPRRVALLGRLADQGSSALARWPADRPFWDGLIDASGPGAVSTRTAECTSLTVGDCPAIDFDTAALRAVRQLDTEIVDNAAHELRTPLTSVRAHAEILPDLLGDGDETARQFLGVIDAEATRMGGLLDELRAVLTFETTVVVHR
jgi:signal transduction histidine kinase